MARRGRRGARAESGLVGLGRLCSFLARRDDQALANRLLAREFSGATDRLSPLPRRARRWFLVKAPEPHLPKDSLSLQLLLQDAERLIDVVVTYEHLQDQRSFAIRKIGPNQQRLLGVLLNAARLVNQALLRRERAWSLSHRRPARLPMIPAIWGMAREIASPTPTLSDFVLRSSRKGAMYKAIEFGRTTWPRRA